MAASKIQEVEQVMDDFVMDEDDYSEEVTAQVGDMPQAEAGSKTTSTANFMGDEPVIVDEIEDLGIVVVDPEADGYIVRVIADVGPVFYGAEKIELKRGHKYRVPPHIHRYLQERDLLWEQQ
jgi:uncharacterized protein YwlG (UPF0340 family)